MLIYQRPFGNEANSKSDGPPLGTPNSKSDGTPMGTPYSKSDGTLLGTLNSKSDGTPISTPNSKSDFTPMGTLLGPPDSKMKVVHQDEIGIPRGECLSLCVEDGQV
jgi:hypothetical protein